jgi:hypothetical protein
MARRRSRHRNYYRAGSDSHDCKATLNRQAALDRALAARAKTPETRRRMQRRYAAGQRALREIKQRDEYRSHLNEEDRRALHSTSVEV